MRKPAVHVTCDAPLCTNSPNGTRVHVTIIDSHDIEGVLRYPYGFTQIDGKDYCRQCAVARLRAEAYFVAGVQGEEFPEAG